MENIKNENNEITIKINNQYDLKINKNILDLFNYFSDGKTYINYDIKDIEFYKEFFNIFNEDPKKEIKEYEWSTMVCFNEFFWDLGLKNPKLKFKYYRILIKQQSMKKIYMSCDNCSQFGRIEDNCKYCEPLINDYNISLIKNFKENRPSEIDYTLFI